MVPETNDQANVGSSIFSFLIAPIDPHAWRSAQRVGGLTLDVRAVFAELDDSLHQERP
jgi:hypothetical protein